MCVPPRDAWETEFLVVWRPAAAAWEKHYAELLEGARLKRGESCGVVFGHPKRVVSLAVRGDDSTFCAMHGGPSLD